MILTGNTVRLEGRFFDFNGRPVNPDSVKVILYDVNQNKIGEYLPTLAETGVYRYEHIADVNGIYYYEFYGMIDGVPSLNRGTFAVNFY